MLEHLYFGRREHDVMLQLGGHLAHSLSMEAIPLASNVSRFDVQVTVFTEGLEAHLAKDIFEYFENAPPRAHRPRNYNLTVNRPAGETCEINLRVGDHFGRIYDKGAQARVAPAGLLWRYEVELKRDPAKQTARNFYHSESQTAFAISYVHRWMSKRGVVPLFAAVGSQANLEAQLAAPTRDVLSWFQKSLSKTVATAIEKHGLTTVLDSLGLLKHVQPREV